MKKITCLLLLIPGIILYSCKSDKERAIRNDDFEKIVGKFYEKFKAFNTQKNIPFPYPRQIAYKIKELIFTFKQTRFGDAAFLESDADKVKEITEHFKDTGFRNYLLKVLSLRKAHKVLFFGKSEIIDSNNIHILSFKNSESKEMLLTALNVDINNNQFKIENLKTSTLLLSNYPASNHISDSDSITLMPFEARIYQLR